MEVMEVMDLFDELVDDRGIPKNIREAVVQARTNLNCCDFEVSVRVDKAIEILDDISNDINLPVFARTQIWSIISMLESL